MATRKEHNPYFTKKEELDFQRLCTIHKFKERKVIKDDNNRAYQFEIFLSSISGSVEKCLSNVARYTNSRRKSEPCMLGRRYVIKVSFNKK